MEEEIGTGTSVDSGSELSQSGMESDFLQQYQLVDEKTGEPIEETVEPETEEKTVPAQEEPKPQNAEKDVPAASGVTDYTKELYNEDGSLDVEKALSLFGSKEEGKPVEKPAPETAKPKVEAPVDDKQQPVDPMAQMRKNALAAIELQRYYIDRGNDPQTAMALAERDIENHLRDHFQKSEIQKLREEFSKREESFRNEIKNERELATSEPVAEKNLLSVCNKYAKGMSAETLRKAIFDVNLGGQFLSDLFVVANPDKEKLVGNDLAKAMNDWFVKNAARNPRFVEALAKNAINQIQQKVYPEMAKMIQKNAVQRNGIQKATKPGPRTPQNPAAHNPSQTSKAQSDLDVFLGNAPRPDSRPHI